jgi:O-antigen/teichoic acid export membrane protein
MFQGNSMPTRGALQSLLPIVRSYAASGVSLIIGSAAQLATFAILARWLGVHEFSLFVAITAIANVAVHMCGLGGMECLVRRVARDRSIYGAMLGHNIILTAASGIVLVLAGVAILPFFFRLSPDPATNAAVIALMLVTNIILVRVIILIEQIFIAHGDYAPANVIVIGFALARTAAVALACIGFGVATVAQWALWQFAAHLLVALACAGAVRRLGRPSFRIVREELPQGVFFSVPFILHAVRQNADLLVLSLVASAEIMASYSLARRMLESSYLAVEALNRLLYPTLARAAAEGLHNAVPVVRRSAAAAAFIGVATAVAVYILAPVLPYIFGPAFVRILCWIVVPFGIASIALEAIGASGHQAQRAMVLGVGSILGAALSAWATWYSPPAGTFISFYVIEFVMLIASWRMFARLVRDDRAASARRKG